MMSMDCGGQRTPLHLPDFASIQSAYRYRSHVVGMGAVSAVSLHIHEVVRTARVVCTALSLLLIPPVLTLIYLCANRISKYYSTLLALFVIQQAVIDVVREFMYDPIMLLPETCTLRQRPLIPIGGSANLFTELWVLSITVGVPVNFACIMERHQAVQRPVSRWHLSTGARYALTTATVVTSILVPSLLTMAEMDPESERVLLQSITNRWPSLEVEQAGCFEYRPYTAWLSLCVIGLICCAIGTAVVTFPISWHTFASVKSATTLSENTKKLYWSLTKALSIQGIFPVFLIILPLFVTLILVLNHARGPLPLSICMLVMSFHPPVSSIILVAFTPIYRSKMVEQWERVRNFHASGTTKVIRSFK